MDLISPFWTRAALPALVVVGSALAYGAFWPRSRLFGPVVWRRETIDTEPDARRLGLLFESAGGVDPEQLRPILEILRQTNAPAAFALDFATATNTPPRLLRAIHDAGHLLVNAGPRFALKNLFAGYADWRHAIDATEDAIHHAIGLRPLLFAPPLGFKSPVMLREAAWGGHLPVVRARGQHVSLSRRLDTFRLRRAPAAGVVTLRLDHARTREQLPALLDAWRNRGRGTTRIDRLLNVPPYRRGDERPADASGS